jgi:hypothetical protein
MKSSAGPLASRELRRVESGPLPRRACASKRVNRWRRHGELGLHDRPSTPHHSPDATPAWVIERIETWRREKKRREKKWSSNRITDELAELDFRINRRTVTRRLTRLGLGQGRFIDPSGRSNRKPGKIIARWPGHMAHLDVKKVGRIHDGGGWRIHGRNSAQKRQSTAPKPQAPRPVTSTCTPSRTGSPDWPTPRHQRPALIHLGSSEPLLESHVLTVAA